MATTTAFAECSMKNLIGFGMFTFVHRIAENRARKVPHHHHDPDAPEALRREAHIYTLFNGDRRAATCLEATDTYVDLEYYANGTLKDYVSKNVVSEEQRKKWGAQMIDGLVLLHSHKVIHSDLRLRQYLLDDDLNARITDFSSSSMPSWVDWGLEDASHCLPRVSGMPNSVTTDLFALGSVLYELAVGEDPYKDLPEKEIEERYSIGKFPDTADLFCGDIIRGCWTGRFSSSDEVLAEYKSTVLKKQWRWTLEWVFKGMHSVHSWLIGALSQLYSG